MHWLSAVLIVFMLGLGLDMVELVTDPARKFELYQLHKSFGMLVLALMLVRLVWRFGATAPQRPAMMSRTMQQGAVLVQVVLYAAIFALAITGYISVSASTLPLPVELPGGFSVPNLVSPDYTLSETMKLLHHWVAWGLLALLGLHVAAALKHHFWDKDDVLRQMLPALPGIRPSRRNTSES